MFAARNLLLTPPAAAASPAFDVAASGAQSASAGASLTWSQTVTAGNAVLLAVDLSNGFGTPAATSATCAGTSMTLLGSAINTTGNRNSLYLYGLTGVSTGSKTMVINFNSAATAAANSVSYQNVTSFGTAATNKNTGTSLSLSVTSSAGKLAFVAFGADISSAITSFNKTSRATQTDAGGGFGHSTLLMGEAAGASSVSFTGSIGSSNLWGAVGVSIN